jgi:hypothetical protein
MNNITVKIGEYQLIYELAATPIAASWVNWLYSHDPVHNHHRKFLAHRNLDQHYYRIYQSCIELDSTKGQPPPEIPPSWYRYFKTDIQPGDLVMGWHTEDLHLRQAYQMRDLEILDHRTLARVTRITPEIQLYVGLPNSIPKTHGMERDVLWWLYSHDRLDRVPYMGFELQCHGQPLLARLISNPDPSRLWQTRLKPTDTITEIKITPPACF